MTSLIRTIGKQIPNTMKYILVTGGVISGVGKGVIASSFGTLLNCCGIDVTSIKIDPYINIDAGTFSPYEHGMWDVLEIATPFFVLFSWPLRECVTIIRERKKTRKSN